MSQNGPDSRYILPIYAMFEKTPDEMSVVCLVTTIWHLLDVSNIRLIVVILKFK